MTWAAKYIGEPWVAGANDCWAFARRVWREEFGFDVPAVDVDAINRLSCSRAFRDHPERQSWDQIGQPEEGAAVLMGKSDRASHVGIWTQADGGGVVHCLEGVGVVFSAPAALRSTGLKVLGWYRRSECAPTA